MVTTSHLDHHNANVVNNNTASFVVSNHHLVTAMILSIHISLHEIRWNAFPLQTNIPYALNMSTTMFITSVIASFNSHCFKSLTQFREDKEAKKDEE